MTTKQLSCCQVCWSEYLSYFNFVIQFWPGKLGAKPDALTKKSDDFFKAENECIKQMLQTVLKKHNLDLAITLENSKLNIDFTSPLTLSMLFILPMPPTQNFIPMTSMLNLSADNLKLTNTNIIFEKKRNYVVRPTTQLWLQKRPYIPQNTRAASSKC